MQELKSIFEYDDYRQYLRDYYAYSKAHNKKFSFRYFARLGKFKSGNILKIVMDGTIDITAETAAKFAKVLQFTKEEAQFFENLVLFCQAKTSEEKRAHSKELLRSRTYRKIHPLHLFQYRYFDHWYFPIVRGLVALKGFKEDPEWIAARISPPITAAEAKRALSELLKLGLLARNSAGQLIQSNPTVSTSDAITSSSLAQYHREMLKIAGSSIDSVPRDKRELSVMTIGVSAEATKKIKDLSDKFRKDVVEIASRDVATDSLYQLCLYFFPVTETGDKESKA